jgi:hypothetical protein
MMGCMDSQQRTMAEERLRLLELLEGVVERRDEIFEIVDSSEDADEAQERIRQLFGCGTPHQPSCTRASGVTGGRSGRRRIAEDAEELRGLLND